MSSLLKLRLSQRWTSVLSSTTWHPHEDQASGRVQASHHPGPHDEWRKHRCKDTGALSPTSRGGSRCAHALRSSYLISRTLPRPYLQPKVSGGTVVRTSRASLRPVLRTSLYGVSSALEGGPTHWFAAELAASLLGPLRPWFLFPRPSCNSTLTTTAEACVEDEDIILLWWLVLGFQMTRFPHSLGEMESIRAPHERIGVRFNVTPTHPCFSSRPLLLLP